MFTQIYYIYKFMFTNLLYLQIYIQKSTIFFNSYVQIYHIYKFIFTHLLHFQI
jgi:hypothetical protein